MVSTDTLVTALSHFSHYCVTHSETETRRLLFSGMKLSVCASDISDKQTRWQCRESPENETHRH